MGTSQLWKKVWSTRKINPKNLFGLMKYNGYHSEIGSFKKSRTKYFLKYINSITKNFDLKKNDTILDVGCGAGAFLFPFFKRGMKCHGIDYSKNSIKICRKFITNGKFVVGEANNLNKFKKNKYDIISSAAVFQYFDNINYAKRVFNQMNKLSKKGTKILILDIPDKAKKKIFIKDKIKDIGKKEFKRLYGKTPHKFYSKSFFRKLGRKYNFSTQISNQTLGGDKTGKYRFKVILNKK